MAVKEFLATWTKEKPEDGDLLLDRVHNLMVKMRTCKHRGMLRSLGCEKSPKIRGHKWGATFTMIKSYFEISTFIDQVKDQDESLDALVLTSTEIRELTRVKELLSKFDSVTTAIQGSRVNLSEQRALFAALLAEHPTHSDQAKLHHLKPNDPIVFAPDLENGIIKIIDNEEHLLTDREMRSCEILKRKFIDVPEEEGNEETKLDFGRKVLAAKKSKSNGIAQSQFIGLKWIPCSTCEVERLFSGCRHIFSEWRKAMHPETLEIIIYLRINRSKWDIHTVARVKNK